MGDHVIEPATMQALNEQITGGVIPAGRLAVIEAQHNRAPRREGERGLDLANGRTG